MIPDLYYKFTLACLIPQSLKAKDLETLPLSSAEPEAMPELRDCKPLIRAEELPTHIGTKVLNEHPSSSDKNVFYLLFYWPCIGISTQAA